MILSSVLSLMVGLAVGYFGHTLQTRQAAKDRAIDEAVELWDRCAEVANARVKYVLAYHRRSPNAPDLNEAHKDLKRRFRRADPELLLVGVPEWEAYHRAERQALADKPIPADRIKELERLGYGLFDMIGRRQAAARKV